MTTVPLTIRASPNGTTQPLKRPIVLHIGDPIKYNPKTYAEFAEVFEVIRPSSEERERGAFIQALKEKRWGDFAAIFRPFWGTGGEMGRWDAELIGLLPDSVKVFASAGAGFDWADTKILGEKGELPYHPSDKTHTQYDHNLTLASQPQASYTATPASPPPKQLPTSP